MFMKKPSGAGRWSFLGMMGLFQVVPEEGFHPVKRNHIFFIIQVGVDGTCVFGDAECIHSRRMRLADHLNDYAPMEECYIKPVRED